MKLLVFGKVWSPGLSLSFSLHPMSYLTGWWTLSPSRSLDCVVCCACHGIDTASIYCPLSWEDQTSLHGCLGTLLCSHALILTKWFVASSKPDRANLHPYAGNIFILNGLLSNCLWCIDVVYLPTIAIFLADNRKEVVMIQSWACHTHSACPIFFALFNSTMSITTETSKIICSLFLFSCTKAIFYNKIAHH